jgi:hypothetical protein
VERVVELFPELQAKLSHPAGDLSGGQQQMVSIAQSLVIQPKFLVIDELSFGLSPLVVARLVPILRQVAQSGVGVLLIEPWALDTAGNVSAPVADSLVRTVFFDSVAPVIDSFSILDASPVSSMSVPVTLSYHDPGASSGGLVFRITESSSAPSSCVSAPGSWSASALSSYTATGCAHTLYAWVCDAAGNVSQAFAGQPLCVDLAAPQITLFQTQDATITTPVVGNFTLHVSDDCGVAN